MPLPTLQHAIEQALSTTATNDSASSQRASVARQIAQAVDAYVQEQIGLRLASLPGAIMTPCPTPAGPVPTPPVPGPGFTAFSRTS